jgi:DNA modification methylase
VAAKRQGRDYLGIDLNDDYCKIAIDRVARENHNQMGAG